ncbi:Release factor glutamine methyltransferase [Rubripirellula lacrimiformis]|uniref:Release factor glutamine methyltransferase n=1 Tax=Rubripirellula lacrimiformis TaxID=1930273 RepID=A0A517N5S3_9BACT|nr:peptide chain release factor N(5)-glutamine methyltransferase [Rubripirellula lacrimiformis]QDT02485.1 Release factor glutamine methyltransferase [Rubripirellula lacrimiformis]
MSASQQEPWTVLRLLEWTTDFFKKKGSDSPRLDAEVLLAHARNCTRIELYTAFGEEPGEEQRIAFREMVRRRGEGTPVAQLVGYREFYSLRFRVDDSVLIPRPETEHLVIEALDFAKASGVTDRPLQIADIGTGSGAIAVAVAKNFANCEVTAVDRSASALKIATWNAEQHGVSDRVTFLESDLLAAVDAPAQFDIICTNPPYVSDSEYDELSPTVRDHEPKTALVSGPLGTEIIQRIIQEVPPRMHSGGWLIIELSPMIAEACGQIAKDSEHFADQHFIKDLEGHKRILSVQRC